MDLSRHVFSLKDLQLDAASSPRLSPNCVMLCIGPVNSYTSRVHLSHTDSARTPEMSSRQSDPCFYSHHLLFCVLAVLLLLPLHPLPPFFSPQL